MKPILLFFCVGIIEAWNPFSFFLSIREKLSTRDLFSIREKLSKRENLSKKENLSKPLQQKISTKQEKNKWYIIGKSNEFEANKPYSIVLQEKKYVVWKDGSFSVEGEGKEGFYALENQCSHKGAALSNGFIDQGCIVCPFHFSYFSKDGSLILGNTIIKDKSQEKSQENPTRKNTSIPSYSIFSRDNWIYLNPNPYPDLLKESFPIYNTSTSKEKTEIETDYACSAEIIAEKMLDIIHYYQDPNPGPNDLLILQQPRWISSKRTNHSILSVHGQDGSQDASQAHGQTIYQFRSGIRPINENLFTQKVGRTFFTVESEFVLPYTFITRIQKGEDTLKIISCISPISSKKCRVYTKIHRNFGKNWFGEYMVRKFVHTFLEHNREILEKIDYDTWKKRGPTRYYHRQEKMIRFYRQVFDSWFSSERS